MMDERAVFERFHEALDLESRPGAYERFRAAFINPPAAAKRRPVFQMRLSRMSLRVAAALAVVAIAVALVAGYVVTHRSTSAIPAGHGQNTLTSPAVTASPSGKPTMDPAIVPPIAFPKDFPVYPGARTTGWGADSSFGFTILSLNWETTDSIEQVYAWYRTSLGQGDWTITSKTSGADGQTISFARKSNSSCTGDLVISQRYPGVTQMNVTVCGST